MMLIERNEICFKPIKFEKIKLTKLNQLACFYNGYQTKFVVLIILTYPCFDPIVLTKSRSFNKCSTDLFI